MDEFLSDREMADLASRAGADAAPLQDHPEASLPLLPQIKGDKGYKAALEKAAEALHGMVTAVRLPGQTHKPQLTALQYLLHSLAHVASRRQAPDGSYLRYVALPLKHSNFSPAAEYWRLSKTHFPKMVRALASFDPEGNGKPWLHIVEGYNNRTTGEGRRTRGQATAPFLDWMVQQGLIFPWHPRRKPANRQSSKASASLLWASEKDAQDTYDEWGEAVSAYPVLRPLQGDELILPALNEALHAQKVDCCLSSYTEYEGLYQFRTWRPRKDGKPSKGGKPGSPLGGNRWLYRQFSRRDGRAGRLYGHWVQRLPSEYRQKLTIDGKPTVELDYVAMQLVLLYALHGEQVPAGDDLYALPGMPPHRDDMKLILTRSVGNGTREATIRSVEQAWRQERRSRVSHAATRYDTFWSYHSAVCPHRPSTTEPVWPQLQHLDSQIALRVLRKLLDQGITAIPIHDSFIVQRRHADVTEQVMQDAFTELCPGTPIRVKRT